MKNENDGLFFYFLVFFFKLLLVVLWKFITRIEREGFAVLASVKVVI